MCLSWPAQDDMSRAGHCFVSVSRPRLLLERGLDLGVQPCCQRARVGCGHVAVVEVGDLAADDDRTHIVGAENGLHVDDARAVPLGHRRFHRPKIGKLESVLRLGGAVRNLLVHRGQTVRNVNARIRRVGHVDQRRTGCLQLVERVFDAHVSGLTTHTTGHDDRVRLHARDGTERRTSPEVTLRVLAVEVGVLDGVGLRGAAALDGEHDPEVLALADHVERAGPLPCVRITEKHDRALACRRTDNAVLVELEVLDVQIGDAVRVGLVAVRGGQRRLNVVRQLLEVNRLIDGISSGSLGLCGGSCGRDVQRRPQCRHQRHAGDGRRSATETGEVEVRTMDQRLAELDALHERVVDEHRQDERDRDHAELVAHGGDVVAHDGLPQQQDRPVCQVQRVAVVGDDLRRPVTENDDRTVLRPGTTTRDHHERSHDGTEHGVTGQRRLIGDEHAAHHNARQARPRKDGGEHVVHARQLAYAQSEQRAGGQLPHTGVGTEVRQRLIDSGQMDALVEGPADDRRHDDNGDNAVAPEELSANQGRDHEHRCEQQVELLLDAQRPVVLERRLSAVRSKVVGALAHEPPVESADRGQ